MGKTIKIKDERKMRMAKLYELTEKYIKLNSLIEDALSNDDVSEDDLQTFIDTLDSIQDSIEDKVGNIAGLLKNIESDIKAYKAEEERLAKRRKYLQNKYDGLKKYTQIMLESAKIDKLKAGIFNVIIQNNPPSVEVLDENKVPNEYKIPQDPKIDGKRLLEELKAGKVIDGVRLISDKKHLRIT